MVCQLVCITIWVFVPGWRWLFWLSRALCLAPLLKLKKQTNPDAKIAERLNGGKRAEWWHSDAASGSPLECRSESLCSLLLGETWHLADNTTFNLRWFVPQKLWGEMILASWRLPLFPPRQIRDSLPGGSWMIRVETGERPRQPNAEPSSLCSHPTYSPSCN